MDIFQNQINMKDNAQRMQSFNILFEFLYKEPILSDSFILKIVKCFIEAINFEQNLFDQTSKEISNVEKIGFIKLSFHNIFHYLSSIENVFHNDFMNLIYALIRLSLRQELIVYTRIMTDIIITFKEILAVIKNVNQFEFKLIHFQQSSSLNCFTNSGKWNNMIILKSRFVGYRFISIFCEIINFHMSFLTKFRMVDEEFIGGLIECFQFGDFHSKNLSILSLSQLMDLKNLNGRRNQLLINHKMVKSIISLLIEFPKSIVRKKCNPETILESGFKFDFENFQKNWLKLFDILIDGYFEKNDFGCALQKIKDFYFYHLNEKIPSSDFVYWSILIGFCKIVNNIKEKTVDDHKYFFKVSLKCLDNVSNYFQFQIIGNFIISILSDTIGIDQKQFDGFVDTIIYKWRLSYENLIQVQSNETVNMFIMNSRLLNFLLLNKRSISENDKLLIDFHLCSKIQLNKILQPNFLVNLVNNCKENSEQLIKILSIFVEEFCVTREECNYSESDWKKIINLIAFWYFKSNQQTSETDYLSNILKLEFNHSLSYFLLSFLPNDFLGGLKSDIFKILWEYTFEEVDLFFLFESLRNDVFQGFNFNELLHILESVYNKYKDNLLRNVRLTEEFYHSLRVLHCRICGTCNTINHSVLLRKDSALSYPLSITLSINCLVCNDKVHNIDLQCDRRELQNLIINFIMDLLRDYLESQVKLPYQQAFSSLLMSVVYHCSWNWKEESMLALVSIFRICFNSSDIKLQHDTGSYLMMFAKRLSNNNRFWPMLQQTLLNNFEEIIDKKTAKSIEPIIYAIESLLKVVPLPFLAFNVRLLCKIALFTDFRFSVILSSAIKRTAAYRKINEEQIFNQCIGVVVEIVCNSTEFQQSIIERLSDVFNIPYVTFYKMLLPHIFIHLVVKGGHSSHSDIEKVLEFVTWIKPTDNHFKRIIQTLIIPESIVYFYLNIPPEQFPEIRSFLRNHFGSTMEQLISYNDITRTIHLFMLHLSEKPNNVYAGLKWIAVDVLNIERAPDRNALSTDFNIDKIGKFLREYSVGILDFFKSQLLNDNLTMQEQEKIVCSFEAFIKLIKNGLKNIHIMCFSILKICLKFTSLRLMEKSYIMWTEFITLLDFSDLEGLLVESIAVLLYLDNPLMNRVKDILNYVFSKLDYIKSRISDLHFILEFPSLIEYHMKLQKIIVEVYNPDDLFVSLLKCCNRNLLHDSFCVRYLAANNLFSILSQSTSQLSKLMSIFKEQNETNSNNVELIHNLNHSLISAITKDSSADATIFGRCLGLLGAVDPGRFRELTTMKTMNSKTVEFVTSPKFSYSLLCELGKVYLSVTNKNQMDAAAVTIQDMLKTLKIPGSNFKSAQSLNANSTTKINETEIYCSFQNLISGQELWDMFSNQTKEIFQPFFKSKYILMFVIDWSYVTPPILTLSEGMELDTWICTWAGYLVHLMENVQHISVFSNLKVLIKNDVKFSMFILPHAILAILIENNPAVIKKIEIEIISIFKAISSDAEDEKILNNSSIMQSDVTQNSLLNLENNKFLQSAGQIIFNILDYLQLWMNQTWMEIIQINVDQEKSKYQLLTKNYQIVHTFVNSIPNNLLANVSYKCGSLERSIQHWMFAYQNHLEEGDESASKKRKEIILGLLQAHVALNNSDEVTGYLSSFKSDLEPFAQTLKLEFEEKHDLALSIYEQQLLEENRKNKNYHYQNDSVDIFQSIFRCQLLNMAALPSVIARTECCLNDPTFPLQHYELFNNFRIEALYKIGDWKGLEKSLNLVDDNHDNWTMSITKSLCHAKNEKSKLAHMNLLTMWKKTLLNLKASSIEGGDYERIHKDLSKFAMLTEIEMILSSKVLCIWNEEKSWKTFRRINPKDLPDFFNQRYKLSETNIINQECLLTLHYNLFQLILDAEEHRVSGDSSKKPTFPMHYIKNEIGQIWLKRCKVARRAGQFSSAMACLLNVEKYDYLEFSIERGKLLWKMGRIEESLNHFDQAIQSISEESVKGLIIKPNIKVDRFGKLLLLRAHLSDITCRYDFITTKKLYEDVEKIQFRSEVAHFRLAHFLDETMKVTDDYNKITLEEALREYGHALMFGCKFVYQSVSRLLSLWLDKTNTSNSDNSYNIIMRKNINEIPKFQFYIALSQILSRLCYENNKEIVELLDELVAKIFLSFPQQTAWSLMSLEGSSYKFRRDKFDHIVGIVKCAKKDMAEFIYKMMTLCKRLREISEIDEVICGKSPIDLRKCGKSISNLLQQSDYSSIMIPLHHQLFGILPTPSMFDKSFSPFPSKAICIANIEDVVYVLTSLTKPKKMLWLGTNGEKYIILAKPKDDLRRDFRIMELNGMFNRLMHRNSETRHRLLYIRTYAVTPLGEKCGIIEWVNNTEGFRQIVCNLLAQQKKPIIIQDISARYAILEDSVKEKYRKFTEKILPMHPVVFHKWFLQRFPEPGSWYRSLQRYSRSVAVMSMVGYIIGLGDRHIENILFDYTNGDIVHIDFNCLFNHGKSLQWPEVVPFRLTRNMQDALGPCGYNNGLFHSSCVATLRLLRNEIEPIMAVFRPMIYDTEVKDSKGKISNKQGSVKSTVEGKLEDMMSRLKGKVNQLPLSPEGQVNYLIAEAVDNKLLCQMYIGWGPYM